MKIRIGIIIIATTLAISLLTSKVQASADSTGFAFPNKLIFAETPDIGYKWRPGLRLQVALSSFAVDTFKIILPFPMVEGYWNAGGLFSIDFFFTGYPNLIINRDTVNHDSTTIADNFHVITLKSKPFSHDFGPVVYKVGGGIKLYGASTTLKNTADAENAYEKKDNAVSIFITQSALAGGFNHFNLYSSLSLRKKKTADGESIYPSWYFVPGYEVLIGRRHYFSLGIEYYFMNPVQLPMKLVQYLGSADNLEVENYSQNFFDYLFYRVSFHKRKVRTDITYGSHWSFTGPQFVMIGIGFNF